MELADIEKSAQLVPIPEASELLGQHPNTVRRRLNSGELVGRRFGRRDWGAYVIWDGDTPIFMFRAGVPKQKPKVSDESG